MPNLRLPGLSPSKESNHTAEVDQRIRQGAVVDFIFPSKARYQRAKGEGAWLKVVLGHPRVTMSKSRSKWNDFEQMAEWGWNTEVELTTHYQNIDGVNNLVGDSEGLIYKCHHSKEIFVQESAPDIRYPVSDCQQFLRLNLISSAIPEDRQYLCERLIP